MLCIILCGVALFDVLSRWSEGSTSDVAGFLLFDLQIRDIVTHRLSSNPLFLRVLLRWGGHSLMIYHSDVVVLTQMSSLGGEQRVFSVAHLGGVADC